MEVPTDGGPAQEDTSSAMYDLGDSEDHHVDICRVCRSEGTADRPLYYPCLCTGSIKYVHQECLMQWLKYSKKEICELCTHKYSFQPIYLPDMPKRLPVADVVLGMGRNVVRLVRAWCLYTVVVIAWLGIVPLTACRIYRAIFSGSVTSLLLLPLELLSIENLLADCARGCFIVSVFLCTFICLVWLREQIIHGGPQQWLNLDVPGGEAAAQVPVAPAEAGERGGGGDSEDEGGEGEGEGDRNGEPREAPAEEEQPAAAPVEENNWPEWDRVGDDLTWERLLGLDGSLVFLEHVFWVISLNTFFTIVFAFSPYHVGNVAVSALKLRSYVTATRFPGILTTLIGYLIISVAVFLLHKLAKFFRVRLAHRATGMSYLVLKVFLLVLVEIGLFPLLCGWWLDICSLVRSFLLQSSTVETKPVTCRLCKNNIGINSFATLQSRIQAFTSAPGTSMFIHWLVGMVYVFYFASFVLVLREVLRPGVLWFLRNLNDPEFNPIQEMIQLPVLRHLRRLVASTSLFSVTILLVVFYPIGIIQKLLPSVLPYNISLTAETPLSELSLELLLLQVILPALLEQSHARVALKTVVRWWCVVVGRMLDLTEYLLPTDENANAVPPPVVDADALGGGLAAEHQALLLAREPVGFQPYRRPSWFAVRIIALLCCLCATTVLFSILCFVVPVVVGRATIYLVTGHARVHELYTVASGLYVSWLALKLMIMIAEWLPRGWRVVVNGFHQWFMTCAKVLAAGLAVVGLVPFLLGTCFQLIVIAPMRVSRSQSPLFFPWQDWAMGVLHCKIACAAIMMGPDWWMKTAFERLYQDGLRNLNLKYLYTELVFPIIVCFGLVIAVPYALSNAAVSVLGGSLEERLLFLRHSYPALLLFFSCLAFIIWQCEKIRGLAQRIRNDKYLVGTQLVNYERHESPPDANSEQDRPRSSTA